VPTLDLPLPGGAARPVHQYGSLLGFPHSFWELFIWLTGLLRFLGYSLLLASLLFTLPSRMPFWITDFDFPASYGQVLTQ
jgi:hypothetical protein